jgi:hypothetical protein
MRNAFLILLIFVYNNSFAVESIILKQLNDKKVFEDYSSTSVKLAPKDNKPKKSKATKKKDLEKQYGIEEIQEDKVPTEVSDAYPAKTEDAGSRIMRNLGKEKDPKVIHENNLRELSSFGNDLGSRKKSQEIGTKFEKQI